MMKVGHRVRSAMRSLASRPIRQLFRLLSPHVRVCVAFWRVSSGADFAHNNNALSGRDQVGLYRCHTGAPCLGQARHAVYTEYPRRASSLCGLLCKFSLSPRSLARTVHLTNRNPIIPCTVKRCFRLSFPHTYAHDFKPRPGHQGVPALCASPGRLESNYCFFVQAGNGLVSCTDHGRAALRIIGQLRRSSTQASDDDI